MDSIYLVFSPILLHSLTQGGKKDVSNRPSKSCGKQLLKNFTWSIFEHFVPNDSVHAEIVL